MALKNLKKTDTTNLKPLGVTVTSNNLSKLLEEYDTILQKTKILNDRKKELAQALKDYAVNNGTKDSNGSSFCNTDHFMCGNVAKKSVSLNFEKAKEFLVSKGFYQDVVEMQETINEKKLEELVKTGDITIEELEKVTDTKVTYAISVKPLKKEDTEEMPEIQQVASKKRPLKLKHK